MTIGELAELFNAENHIGADLNVVSMKGWERGDWFDSTGLPWVNPSPNMRSLTAALLYPGMAMLEYSPELFGGPRDRCAFRDVRRGIYSRAGTGRILEPAMDPGCQVLSDPVPARDSPDRTRGRWSAHYRNEPGIVRFRSAGIGDRRPPC